MSEKVIIKIVDGVPCIVLEKGTIVFGTIRGSSPLPLFMQFYEIKPKDFTKIQKQHEQNWLQRVLKELEDFFKNAD